MDSSTVEFLKLIVSALTPISVVIIGLFINKRLKVFEHKQWKNQKLIEKRLEIYSDIAPLFNDLLCYFTYVGNWKESSPCDIIKLKRVIDRKINLATPLFSNEFLIECNKFIELCYIIRNGWGKDAKLRTAMEKRKEFFAGQWKEEWNDHFCPLEMLTDKARIKDSYSEIMKIFSKEIGLQ